MVEINGDRLLADLHSLRQFGARGNGVVRPTFSDQDMAAREWLRSRMTDAGLSAVVDGAANVFGRSPNPGPGLVMGSHCDTQPRGGWLDGAMGVIYALEIARAALETPETSHLTIDAVAWADEEGTYSSCLGARSFVAGLDDAQLAKTNEAGESVAEARRRAGVDTRSLVRFDPERHVSYLEAHIEQGPYLEEEELKIGVVTSIVGIRDMRVRFVGEQNHAGTTPMERRSDAAVSMFDFGSRLQSAMAAAAGGTSVWTTGIVSVHPGAESIIPGEAEMVIQYRDANDAVLDAMTEAALTLVDQINQEGSVEVLAERPREAIEPTLMDTGLRGHLGRAAQHRVGDAWKEMASAAGHDAMVLSHHLPCGMLFIPSIGGVSHDFAEDSHEGDIVTGCQVMADAALSFLNSL